MIRFGRRSVQVLCGMGVVILGWGALDVGTLQVHAGEPVFCRKPRAEVERLEREQERLIAESKARESELSSLRERFYEAEVRNWSLRREVALLRGQDLELQGCDDFSSADLRAAPVGMRCRYGAEFDNVAEKVKSQWTSQAWKDARGLVWDLNPQGESRWLVSKLTCTEAYGRLPNHGEFARASATGFLSDVLGRILGDGVYWTSVDLRTIIVDRSGGIETDSRSRAQTLCVW